MTVFDLSFYKGTVNATLSCRNILFPCSRIYCWFILFSLSQCEGAIDNTKYTFSLILNGWIDKHVAGEFP
jgi:hypothetical protein